MDRPWIHHHQQHVRAGDGGIGADIDCRRANEVSMRVECRQQSLRFAVPAGRGSSSTVTCPQLKSAVS